jgi:hypothetical protein
MWVVTFYKDNAELAEVEIPSEDAQSRIHAILAAVRQKPGVIDRSDDVTALEVPDDLEEVT